MIIVAMTDIHGDVAPLARIAKELEAADLVLLTGDITHFGRRAEILQVLRSVKACNPRILAVPGNCDYPEVDAALREEGASLDCRVREMGGVQFMGVGGSIPCPGATPNEMTEEELRLRLDRTAAGLDPSRPFLLVTHQPPFGTAADRLRGGHHVGSRAVRAFIEARKPLVCFSGHIHDGRGIDAIGPTRVVNPGPLNFGWHAYAVIGGADGASVETLELREHG